MIEELKRIRSILSYLTWREEDDQEYIEDARKAIDALIEQQPADEPVAWMNPYGGVLHALITGLERQTYTIPLYTRPQPAAWVGLTDEEVDELDCVKAMWPDYDYVEIHGVEEFARAIDQRLKEKNGGKA